MSNYLIFSALVLISCTEKHSENTDETRFTVPQLSSTSSRLDPAAVRTIHISDSVQVQFSQPFDTCTCNAKVDTLWNEIGIRTPKGYFLVDSSRFLLASPADDEISPAKDAYALHYFIPWQQDSFLLTHSRGASWALDKWEPVFLDLSKKGWAQYNSAALGALSDNPRAGNALNYYFHEDGSLSDVMGTRYYLLSRLIAQDRTWMAAHRRAISAGRLKKYQELKDDSLVTAPYHEDLEALFEEARKYR